MTLQEAWMHIKNSLQWCEPIPVLDESIAIVEKALEEKELKTARKSTEPPLTMPYPTCPQCYGHHVEQLYGTATYICGTNGYKNNFVFHYKCLDCGEEFDRSMENEKKL